MAIKVYHVANMTGSGSMTIRGHRFEKVAASSFVENIRKEAKHYQDRGYAVRAYQVWNRTMKKQGEHPEYFLFVRRK